MDIAAAGIAGQFALRNQEQGARKFQGADAAFYKPIQIQAVITLAGNGYGLHKDWLDLGRREDGAQLVSGSQPTVADVVVVQFWQLVARIQSHTEPVDIYSPRGNFLRSVILPVVGHLEGRSSHLAQQV